VCARFSCRKFSRGGSILRLDSQIHVDVATHIAMYLAIHRYVLSSIVCLDSQIHIDVATHMARCLGIHCYVRSDTSLCTQVYSVFR